MAEKLELPASEGDGSRRINLVLGCTGSIAAIKIPEILRLLLDMDRFNIVLLPSKDALHFFNLPQDPHSSASVETIPADDTRLRVFKDEDEYRFWHHRSDPVLHIELRRWAHILLIAPLSADTLAKLAGGRCDTLLLEVLRAWDYTETGNETGALQKRLIACPAMNTHMYLHPLTARHLKVLREDLKFELLGPIEKRLACGDMGAGGMTEPKAIVERMSILADDILKSNTSIS